MGRGLVMLMWEGEVELRLLFAGLVLARPRGFCGRRGMLRRLKLLLLGRFYVEVLMAAVVYYPPC